MLKILKVVPAESAPSFRILCERVDGSDLNLKAESKHRRSVVSGKTSEGAPRLSCAGNDLPTTHFRVQVQLARFRN